MKKKIKIFADTAFLDEIKFLEKKKYINGFTTNPSLMRKAGAKNYKDYCKKILKYSKNKPTSFEIFSDNQNQAINEALEIASWGENLYVKIPIINTKGKSNINIIKFLSNKKINLNITAVFSYSQVKLIVSALNPKTKNIISIFAGRIADTGRDPSKIIKKSVKLVKKKNIEILWASTRELFNIIEAASIGCNIITVGPAILKKYKLFNYSLLKLCKDTVVQFKMDAKKSKFSII